MAKYLFISLLCFLFVFPTISNCSPVVTVSDNVTFADAFANVDPHGLILVTPGEYNECDLEASTSFTMKGLYGVSEVVTISCSTLTVPFFTLVSSVPTQHSLDSIQMKFYGGNELISVSTDISSVHLDVSDSILAIEENTTLISSSSTTSLHLSLTSTTFVSGRVAVLGNIGSSSSLTVQNCSFQCSSTHPCFEISHISSMVVDGSRFEGPSADNGGEGCIRLSSLRDVSLINNNRFFRCSSVQKSGGGAVSMIDIDNVVVRNSEFIENFAPIGGALSITHNASSSTLMADLSDNLFLENACTLWGAAIYSNALGGVYSLARNLFGSNKNHGLDGDGEDDGEDGGSVSAIVLLRINTGTVTVISNKFHSNEIFAGSGGNGSAETSSQIAGSGGHGGSIEGVLHIEVSGSLSSSTIIDNEFCLNVVRGGSGGDGADGKDQQGGRPGSGGRVKSGLVKIAFSTGDVSFSGNNITRNMIQGGASGRGGATQTGIEPVGGGIGGHIERVIAISCSTFCGIIVKSNVFEGDVAIATSGGASPRNDDAGSGAGGLGGSVSYFGIRLHNMRNRVIFEDNRILSVVATAGDGGASAEASYSSDSGGNGGNAELFEIACLFFSNNEITATRNFFHGNRIDSGSGGSGGRVKSSNFGLSSGSGGSGGQVGGLFRIVAHCPGVDVIFVDNEFNSNTAVGGNGADGGAMAIGGKSGDGGGGGIVMGSNLMIMFYDNNSKLNFSSNVFRNCSSVAGKGADAGSVPSGQVGAGGMGGHLFGGIAYISVTKSQEYVYNVDNRFLNNSVFGGNGGSSADSKDDAIGNIGASGGIVAGGIVFVHTNDQSHVLSGCEFIGNVVNSGFGGQGWANGEPSTITGGASLLLGTKIFVSRSKFIENRVDQGLAFGGALAASPSDYLSEISIERNEFRSNSVKSKTFSLGGATFVGSVECFSPSFVSITDNTFDDNVMYDKFSHGGALAIQNVHFSAVGNIYRRNSIRAAFGSGGAVVYSYHSVCNASGVFSKEVFDSNFVEKSNSNGGAVSFIFFGAQKPLQFQMNHCNFVNNYALDGNGGCLHVDPGFTTISIVFRDSYFGNNFATRGGALYLADGDSMEVSRSMFVDNHAKSEGGGMVINTCTSSVYNNTFENNYAGLTAGAVKIDILANNDAVAGGGGGKTKAILQFFQNFYTKNNSPRGGAIFGELQASSGIDGYLSFQGEMLSNNTAITIGGTFYLDVTNFKVDVTNCSILGSLAPVASVLHSVLQHSYNISSFISISGCDIECSIDQYLDVLQIQIVGGGGGHSFISGTSNRLVCPAGFRYHDSTSSLANNGTDDRTISCDQCNSGYYPSGSYLLDPTGLPANDANTTCHTCPKQAYCGGGKDVFPNPGHYLQSYTSCGGGGGGEQTLLKVSICPPDHCCSSNEDCESYKCELNDARTEQKRNGVVCGECSDGYCHNLVEDCVECSKCGHGSSQASFVLSNLHFVQFSLQITQDIIQIIFHCLDFGILIGSLLVLHKLLTGS